MVEDVKSNDSKRHRSLIALGHESYMPNYQPRNLVLAEAQGSRVRDVEGKEYIDFGSGIGVNSLGHGDPEIIQAVTRQIGRLCHTSNIYFSEPPVNLAAALIEHTFAEKVYFCNSGAEANETAIKIVRKYAAQRHPEGKRTILTFDGSFHGRTIGALAATAQPKYHQGFGPLPDGFRYGSFNDEQDLIEKFSSDVCAVLIEPIQGESGIKPAAYGFLKKIDDLCRDNDALMVFDEIQCGMGRTGKLLAYEWIEDISPDIVTIAKALGGGMPIGAVLSGAKASNVLTFGSHGSTFGGNPVCCAAASVVLRRILKPGFLAGVLAKGEFVQAKLRDINTELDVFSDIRGHGLMIGAELNADCGFDAAAVMEAACANGLLILQAGPKVLRMLPPLTISESDLAKGLQTLRRSIAQLRAN